MPLRPTLVALALVLAASSALAQTPARGQTAEDLAIREAILEYQQTGVARVIEIGQTILAPYNQIEPVLKTALLRTTLVELDRNEYVVDRFIGDSLRWSVDFGVTGSEGNFRQVVSIKPRDQDITTSLVLTTNTGRIYQFTLDSEPYPINQNQNPVGIPYTSHVRFYYPDDGLPPDPLQSRNVGTDGLLWSSTGGAPGTVSGDGFGDLLNDNYDVRTDDGFPCAPTFVGDDGIRLIVRFPDTAEDPYCSTRFPLYAVSEGGELQLLNYSVLGGNTYVTERLPGEARILYLTEDGERREVRIRSRDPRARLPRRPLGVTLDARVSSVIPTMRSAFRDAYNAGVEFGGALGVRATRALTVSLQGSVGRLPVDEAFVGEAVETALGATLAQTLTERLRASSDIAADESVALFSQPSEGELRTVRIALAARLSLAPRARVQPYVGARVGVLRRQTTALALGATGLVVTSGGTTRPSAELDAEIASSFAGAAAGTDAAQADPAYQAFAASLGGAFGQNLIVPSWLLGSDETETSLEVAGHLGLLARLFGPVGVFAEGEFAYAPLGSRADRSVVPLTLGLRADL